MHIPVAYVVPAVMLLLLGVMLSSLGSEIALHHHSHLPDPVGPADLQLSVVASNVQL